jgi:hypothetical protein
MATARLVTVEERARTPLVHRSGLVELVDPELVETPQVDGSASMAGNTFG